MTGSQVKSFYQSEGLRFTVICLFVQLIAACVFYLLRTAIKVVDNGRDLLNFLVLSSNQLLRCCLYLIDIASKI